MVDRTILEVMLSMPGAAIIVLFKNKTDIAQNGWRDDGAEEPRITESVCIQNSGVNGQRLRTMKEDMG